MTHILIIDDDDAIRHAVMLLLSRAGYSVVGAADGAEGTALYRADPVDLVITDLIMPNGEGIETIMGLHREFPTLPMIAMSGDSRASEYLHVARILGAGCTLKKPFSRHELLEKVESILRQRQGQSDARAFCAAAGEAAQ